MRRFLKICEAKQNILKFKADDLKALLADFVLELDGLVQKVDQS